MTLTKITMHFGDVAAATTTADAVIARCEHNFLPDPADRARFMGWVKDVPHEEVKGATTALDGVSMASLAPLAVPFVTVDTAARHASYDLLAHHVSGTALPPHRAPRSACWEGATRPRPARARCGTTRRRRGSPCRAARRATTRRSTSRRAASLAMQANINAAAEQASSKRRACRSRCPSSQRRARPTPRC